MKAAVTTTWNHIEILERPVPEPGPNESLVRVLYAGICGSDVHIYQGHHPTAKAPVIQGHEFVGILEKIGPGLSPKAQIGQRVVVEPLLSCGVCEACRVGHWHVCRKLGLLGIHADGAFAQYVRVPSTKIIKVPDHLDHKIAALSEPFAVGFHVCRRADLHNGETVLVVGAGPIGLIVGMVAAISGASVTFAEVNAARIEQARAMGFSVFDSSQDAMQHVNQITSGEGFDVVIEVSGSQPGTLLAAEACKIRGRMVQVGFFAKRPEADLMKVIFKELTIIGSRVYTFDDFQRTVPMLARIVSEKRFNLETLISDVRPLNKLEDGIRTMMRGECRGKILIDLQ